MTRLDLKRRGCCRQGGQEGSAGGNRGGGSMSEYEGVLDLIIEDKRYEPDDCV